MAKSKSNSLTFSDVLKGKSGDDGEFDMAATALSEKMEQEETSELKDTLKSLGMSEEDIALIS